MKISECLKELQSKKGNEIYPFLVPSKVVQQVKMRFFPNSDFPMNGWVLEKINCENYLVYNNKLRLRIDLFGLVHFDSISHYSDIRESFN